MTAKEIKTGTTDAISNDIKEIIQGIRKGQLSFEASRDLDDLIRAVVETRKPGELTLKLKVVPRTPEATEVEIDGYTDIKKPKANRAKSIFFTTKRGGLQRTDPRQSDNGLAL